MAELKKFAARIKAVARNVEANSTLLTRKVALAVDATVVLATPVDTGRARSNWQASLGAPASGVLPAYQEGKEGSTSGPNAQAAIDQAASVVQEHQPGQEIHITNNLPYIARLNDGYSAQSPAGFVEAAIQVGVDAVRNRASLLKSPSEGNT